MFLISYGKAELRYKVQAKDLGNLPIQWYQYRPIYKKKQSLIETEFAYAVQKFQPETQFFITIGETRYTYNIIMLEDCDANRVVAIATQPFREDGRLDRVQINWYI